MNEIVRQENEELKALEPSKAAQIKAVFEPMVKMLEEFEGEYQQVIEKEVSPDVCAEAKRLRLDIRKVRTAADKVRKDQKEEYLRAGQAIQGVYNILKFAVTDKEQKLEEVETYYERQEAEKVAKLQAEREAELMKYDTDGSQISLGDMDEAVWSNFLAGTKANYEKVKEAERKAEEERLEAERLTKQYYDRERQLLPFSDYIDISELTEATKEKRFKDMLEEGKQAKATALKEQEEIKKANEQLLKEQKRAEELAREERRKREESERKVREEQERVRKEEVQKAEAARIDAEAERERIEQERRAAEGRSDSEKLYEIWEYLKEAETGLTSENAKKFLVSVIVSLGRFIPTL